MARKSRLSRRTLRALIAASVVSIGIAAIALNLHVSDAKSGPFGGQPPPALFPDASLRIVDRVVTAAQTRAKRDMQMWLRAHPGRDDAAFTSFALKGVGAPPTGAAQTSELALLHRIDARRAPRGVRAATWLEAHGKKDVWKLYLKQYGQLASKPQGKEAKRQFKATYKLAKALATDGKNRFARPSPYITDPSLHALNQSRFKKKFSYPAKHSVISFALAPLLSHLEPHRAREYRWMADEISYSRLYAGGHYPSDIAAGAYLGTLLSEYYTSSTPSHLPPTADRLRPRPGSQRTDPQRIR